MSNIQKEIALLFLNNGDNSQNTEIQFINDNSTKLVEVELQQAKELVRATELKQKMHTEVEQINLRDLLSQKDKPAETEDSSSLQILEEREELIKKLLEDRKKLLEDEENKIKEIEGNFGGKEAFQSHLEEENKKALDDKNKRQAWKEAKNRKEIYESKEKYFMRHEDKHGDSREMLLAILDEIMTNSQKSGENARNIC